MTDFTGDDPSKTPTDEATNFNDGSGDAPDEPTTPESDNTEVVFEHEGRKFTKADLVKKLSHSEDFIDRLKKEREEDRALLTEVNQKLAKQVDVAEVLKELREGRVEQPKEEEDKSKVTEQAVDPDKITSDILGKLSEQKQKEVEQENWKSVTATLSKKFSSKTNEVVAERAKENGLTTEEAAQLARTKPKIFLALFPELSGRQESNQTIHRSSTNTAAVSSEQPKKASGYFQSRSIRDKTSTYLSRLKELSE